MKAKVKVCCIKNIHEAKLAMEHGAVILGLVGKMPSGPGMIDDVLIADIASIVPEDIWTFLLTSESSVGGIIRHWERTRTSHIQLVRPLAKELLIELKRRIPDIPLVQVVHVSDSVSIDRALAIEPYCDFLLLDSGNPKPDIPILGGTGQVHNWTVSAQIVKKCTKPVFLAGGLNPDNVVKAMSQVQPYGLDLCSGIRTHGDLDADKLAAFMSLTSG